MLRFATLALHRCANVADHPRRSRQLIRRRARQLPRPSVQNPVRPHRRLQLQSTLVPTRRQRAVSAAVVAPPPHRCSRTGHCGCPRCAGRRDGDWRKPCHSRSTSPTRREATRTRRCIQGRGLARACQCSAPKLKRKHPAAGGQVLWIQKVRFGSAPLCAQQTNTAAIVCTTNKHCNKLCPMDVAATSVRRSDRMHRFADSGQACPSRLSTCPLLGCAGHS